MRKLYFFLCCKQFRKSFDFPTNEILKRRRESERRRSIWETFADFFDSIREWFVWRKVKFCQFRTKMGFSHLPVRAKSLPVLIIILGCSKLTRVPVDPPGWFASTSCIPYLFSNRARGAPGAKVFGSRQSKWANIRKKKNPVAFGELFKDTNPQANIYPPPSPPLV